MGGEGEGMFESVSGAICLAILRNVKPMTRQITQKVNESYERVLFAKGQSDVKAFEAEIGNCRIPRSLARVN